MPLSEHEQRLLDQIERALYAEDPKFATTVRSTDLRTHMRRRLRRATALFVVGFVLMLFGVAEIAVGIVGFVVMLLAMLLGVSAYKRLNGGGATLRAVDGSAERGTRTKTKKTTKRGTGGSPKERLEERWKKRWEERGGQ
ncbi:MAG: hypothetical protein JWO12_19 [Frankiales bacterium]|jgi:hypothetical protein|nr:hypothetical protein [Frankiales bacterium]